MVTFWQLLQEFLTASFTNPFDYFKHFGVQLFDWFSLVSLFNGMSNFVGYSILVEKQQWCYLTDGCSDKRFYNFPRALVRKLMQ